MEEQKYCIKHKLSNGTYLAVLNNGWRYDGSVVVEADTERELEYKLLQARYDDRWVTLNGSHMREISATLPMPKGIDELKNYEER